MIEKVHNKKSLDCESKILIRQRNSPNEQLYVELKWILQSSFGGVFFTVFSEILEYTGSLCEGEERLDRQVYHRVLQWDQAVLHGRSGHHHWSERSLRREEWA